MTECGRRNLYDYWVSVRSGGVFLTVGVTSINLGVAIVVLGVTLIIVGVARGFTLDIKL